MAELKLAGLGLRSYGNLIFDTDNAYDIGASGATRPRDLFLARNAVIGGSLSSGALTASSLRVTGQLGVGVVPTSGIDLYVRTTTAGDIGLYAWHGATTGTNVAGSLEASGSGATKNTALNLFASGATTNYALTVLAGRCNLNLPTSSAGLASGDLWNSSGVVHVA